MPSLPEDEEFRRATLDVEPIAAPRRLPPSGSKPAPVAKQRLRDERAALEESISAPVSADDAMDSGEELVFARQGLSRQTLRRLRRGYWVVEDSLDLHGMNRMEAAASVADFLRHCAQRRLRCVRIVHGKGLGSFNREPVLKRKLRSWLAPREEVLAFCQAPRVHGGGGAVLVLLRAPGPLR
jgi:DNA-nicking Smr family endonuclease